MRKKIIFGSYKRNEVNKCFSKRVWPCHVMTGDCCAELLSGWSSSQWPKREVKATLLLIELMGGWSLGEGCGQAFLGCVSSDGSPGMDWSLDLPFPPTEALF